MHGEEAADYFEMNDINDYVELAPMDEFQLINIYVDTWPLLRLRKSIMYTMKLISWICMRIIKHPIFEGASLCVIVFNSIMLASDDPTAPPTSFSSLMDTVFLIL